MTKAGLNRCFLEKLTYIMKIKRYSNKTISCYVSSLEQFFEFCNKQSKDIYKNDFINYLQNITNKNCSRSKHEQFINAWRLYLEEIHNRKLKYGNNYRPRKENKLPVVLSEEEIVGAILRCKNLKHKAMLSVLYVTGMRRSELLNLKVKDVDSENMLIRIISGKGFKDGNVPLTKSLLKILREYYSAFKPKMFLFEGPHGKYSETSLANVVKNNLNTNPHCLRHSRATNLIENGASTSHVQTLLRHKSIKTTEIYLHVSVNSLRKLHDPLKRAV